MSDPQDFEAATSSLHRRLKRLRVLTALILLFEDVTLHLWRPASWLLLFCGLWLFQIPLFFGTAGPIAALLLFFMGLAALLYKDARALRWPDRHTIDRRIETDSATPHRPLSDLKDHLANPDKLHTQTLWAQSRKALLTTLPRLKIPQLRAFMAQRDPYALRLGILLFFGLGLIIAGPNAGPRIWNGLTPVHLTNKGRETTGVHIWITAPEYTGLGQMVLEGTGKDYKKPLEIPAGSLLKIIVNDGLGTPSLRAGQEEWPLQSTGEDSYTLEKEIPQGTAFSLTQMLWTRAQWPYKLIPDEPPQITLTGEPEPLKNGEISFPLSLYDDYGIHHLTMHMRLDDTVEVPPLGEPVTQKRAILSPAKTAFKTSPLYDLSAHPWAGLPVIFEFSVEDAIGQSTALPPIHMVLPERTFLHPIAKKLITVRKNLIWTPESPYDEAYLVLATLLRFPEKFQHDLIAYMGLRLATSRMIYNEASLETSRSLMALLWDTALRIEDGNLTLAARHLRDTQMAMEEALNNPQTTESEKAALMDELRQALAAYMMELQKEMQKRMAEGKNAPQIPMEMFSSLISPESLSGFLDQLEAQILSGDMSSAQKMLSQLQRMMDMMNPSMAGAMPPDIQMMMEGENILQELIEQQEKLRDQTQKQAELMEKLEGLGIGYGQNLPQNKNLLKDWGMEDMPPPPQTRKNAPAEKLPFINTQPHQVEQESLRLILGQLMLDASEQLSKIPENMGLAEQAMRRSEESLGENRPDKSVLHQDAAIEHLKKAQEDISQQLSARILQLTGMMLSSGAGMRTDPLGRPYGGNGSPNGPNDGSPVKIPNEAEKKRAQEILQILRHRAGELNRPREEIDYFRRLLKQF